MGKSRENSPNGNRESNQSPVQNRGNSPNGYQERNFSPVQNRGNSPVNQVNNYDFNNNDNFNQNRGNSPVNNFGDNSGNAYGNQNRGNSPVNNENFFGNQNRGNSPVNNGNNFGNQNFGESPFNNGNAYGNQNRGNSPVNNGNINGNQNRGNSPVNNGNNFNNQNFGESPFNNGNAYGNQNRGNSPVNNGNINGNQNLGEIPFNNGNNYDNQNIGYPPVNNGFDNNNIQMPPVTSDCGPTGPIIFEQPVNNHSTPIRDPQIPPTPVYNPHSQQPKPTINSNRPVQPVPVHPGRPSHPVQPVHPVRPVRHVNPPHPTHPNQPTYPPNHIIGSTNINVNINNPTPYIPPQHQQRPQQIVMNTHVVSTNISGMYPDDDDINSSRYRQPTIAPLAIPGLPSSYGALAWGQKRPLPPPQARFSNPPDSTPNYSAGQMNIDQETAKQAFITFALSNCCYGKNPAKEAEITNIITSSALHYTLETFTQKRSLHYTYVPYRGEPLDSYQMGPIPDPWSVNCSSNGDFVSCVKNVKVPHTEQVMACYRCNGQGNLRCSGCSGSGRRRCTTCSGTGRTLRHVDGHPQQVTCYSCRGTGQDSCLRCAGRGFIKCSLCTGTCRLKCYLEIEISFVNHKNDYINEHTDLPDELIKTVNGEPILYQTAPTLIPITNFDNKELVANSINLFNQHRNFFSMELPMMQRQRLSLVPVVECNYTWKDIRGRFWIYGREMQIYCDDYPQSCCGCCCCCGGCCECCKCCNCSIQ